MNNESELILEIWDVVREAIPAARREDVALRILKQFEEYGFDIDSKKLEGEDSYLDAALEHYHDHEDSDPHDDEEEQY